MELALYLLQTGTIIAVWALTVRTRRQGKLIDKLVAVLTEGEPRLFLEAPEAGVPKQEFETFRMTLEAFQYLGEKEDFAAKSVGRLSDVQLHEVCRHLSAEGKARMYGAWQKAKEGKKSWL